jgi:hypothetical protein
VRDGSVGERPEEGQSHEGGGGSVRREGERERVLKSMVVTLTAKKEWEIELREEKKET